MSARKRRRAAGRRGSSLVEFALISFELLLVIFATIEFCRMVLVYTSIANSAAIGVRYATVHGGDGSEASSTDICGVVKDYAKVGTLNTANLTCGGTSGGRIVVNWLDGSDTPGSRVQVTMVYPYDPFMSVLPLHVNLGSTSTGVITY
jgi:Flp pilus assembly protein TadG